MADDHISYETDEDGHRILPEITFPWDSHCATGESGSHLVPRSLSPAAEAFRRRGISQDNVEAMLARESDFKEESSLRVRKIMMGTIKSRCLFDNEIRCWAIPHILKIVALPSDRATIHNAKAAFVLDLFSRAPDLDIYNRCFTSAQARLEYLRVRLTLFQWLPNLMLIILSLPQAINMYISSRISSIRKAQGDDLVESRHTARILNQLLPGVDRHRTAWQTWEKECNPVEKEELEVTIEEALSKWKVDNPDKDFKANRMQIQQAAIRKAFETRASGDEEFLSKWKEESKLDVALSRTQL